MVDVFFKDSGGLPKRTLDAPLFARFTDTVFAHFASFEKRRHLPTLEMFSHETPRADINNMFDPSTTLPGVEHTQVGSKICFHNPILRRSEGSEGEKEGKRASQSYTDLRDALAQNGLDRFSITLIDPPFTPLEQRRLYSNASCENEAIDLHDLCLASQDDIDQLYAESIGWAVKHTEHAIIVFGYKNVNLEAHGWKRTAIAICGAGSAHPSVWAVLYTASLKKNLALVAALRSDLDTVAKHQLCDIVHHNEETEDAVAQLSAEHDGNFSLVKDALTNKRGTIATKLIGKQNEWTRFRSQHAPLAPKMHPTYISTMHVLLHDVLALGKCKRVRLHTRLFSLYRTAFKKDATRRRTELFANRRVKTKLCDSIGWKDASFVHLIH
jgi:hypothetical protein